MLENRNIQKKASDSRYQDRSLIDPYKKHLKRNQNHLVTEGFSANLSQNLRLMRFHKMAKLFHNYNLCLQAQKKLTLERITGSAWFVSKVKLRGAYPNIAWTRKWSLWNAKFVPKSLQERGISRDTPWFTLVKSPSLVNSVESHTIGNILWQST